MLPSGSFELPPSNVTASGAMPVVGAAVARATGGWLTGAPDGDITNSVTLCGGTVVARLGARRTMLWSDALRAPLMASVPAGISSAELQALRDTNVTAVAVEGGDGVEKLRKLIDALPPRTRRRDADRPFAVVPTRAAAAAGEEDDEHEHE